MEKTRPLQTTVQILPATSPVKASIPGLHIVANLGVDDNCKLIDHSSFKVFVDRQIQSLSLTKVGEAYYDFSNGGFTGVVCLTESHLSVHTWPETNYLTFDVFLSNYLRDNRRTTEAIYAAVKDFFAATVMFEKMIDR